MNTFFRENWLLCCIGCVVFVLTFIVLGQFVFAHSGGTDAYGCHTCRTNCYSYGLSYGEYHCHQSKGLIQPEYPIRSHDGWTEPWPDYTQPNFGNNSYSYPSIPDCPIFSSYDSLSGSCECNYGYVVSGSSCVSGNSYCYNKYGYSSRYDSLSKSCECSYGYVFGKDVLGQASCISEDQSCKDQYGYNAKSTYSGKCECRYGYGFGTSIIGKTECISNDTICTNKHGYNAEYNTLTNECECSSGYVVNESGASCINGNTYCENKYGYYSQYDRFSDICECEYGYQFNSSGTKCVSEDELCQDLYGYHSNYISYSNICGCDYGYELKNGECVEEKTNFYVPLPTQPSILPKPIIPTPVQPTLPEPAETKTSSPQSNNTTLLKDESSDAGINFELVGNELLRKCGGPDCTVIKWGSTNGTATILGENSGWYEVSVTDNNETNEGWLSREVIPEDTQGKYLATLSKQETSNTTNWIHKFIGWISGLF